MSTPNLFAPENRPMAQRCVELVDDIVNMQTDITIHASNNDIMKGDMNTLIDFIMKANGYETFDAVLNAIYSTLSTEDAAKIKAALAQYVTDMDKMDLTFQANVLLGAVIGVAGVAAKAYDFVSSGALTNMLNKGVNKLKAALQDGDTVIPEILEESEKLVGAVAKDGAEVAEITSVASKIARFCKIVSVISVALDVFLVGLSAWEAHEQHEELITNIAYLNVRRVLCRAYCDEAEAMVDFSGQLKGLLSMWKDNNNHQFDTYIKENTTAYISDIQKAYANISLTSAYNKLAKQDAMRGSYLNYDISLADILAEAAKDPNAPVPVPKQPPTTS